MSMQATIETKLRRAFSPERLEEINESHLHAGHHHTDHGHEEVFDGKGETHFRVRLVSKTITGGCVRDGLEPQRPTRDRSA